MSEKTKHTPGPHEVGSAELSVGYVNIYTEDEEKYLGTVSDEDVGGKEALANATLWAAAPELLEALRELQASCPADPDVNDRFLKANYAASAAIAKAEGRAQ